MRYGGLDGADNGGAEMYFFQIGFKNSVEKFSFQDSDQPPGAWLMAVPLLAESGS